MRPTIAFHLPTKQRVESPLELQKTGRQINGENGCCL